MSALSYRLIVFLINVSYLVKKVKDSLKLFLGARVYKSLDIGDKEGSASNP